MIALQESTDTSDKVVHRGGKRARNVSESENTVEPALSTEPAQQLTSEDQQSVQDGEEASIKKVFDQRVFRDHSFGGWGVGGGHWLA